MEVTNNELPIPMEYWHRKPVASNTLCDWITDSCHSANGQHSDRISSDLVVVHEITCKTSLSRPLLPSNTPWRPNGGSSTRRGLAIRKPRFSPRALQRFREGWHSSTHGITTRSRETFYWLTVAFTFALGTTAGELTADTLGLGYFGSIALFASSRQARRT